MKFSASYFPKYNELRLYERLFLRWCCYFPPKPGRGKTQDRLYDLEGYIRRYENAFTVNIWDFCENKSVLDFGCGEGGYTLALAQKGAGNVLGLDIQDLFDNAKMEAIRLGLDQISFIQASSEVLADNSFDVVISHDSFEHFEDPSFILNEMVRVTKTGGLILIKFGPPWKNPWGRHMSGTIRKDRPWIHLVVPERVIMRVHSVYHNEDVLKEKYDQLNGGLNKMTLNRFKKLISCQPSVELIDQRTTPIFNYRVLTLSIIKEYFASSVMVLLRKDDN